jgi:hypothetical protein
LQFWLPVFFIFNFVWPALWLCNWLYDKSKPLFYKINKFSVKFKFCSFAPSASAARFLNTRVSKFCYRAFPLDQFVKFLFKPGQINLVDSSVTVAHLPHFYLLFFF